MKQNIMPALKVVGMSVFAVLLSFFVYVSLFFVVRQFSTEVVGYTVYGADGAVIGVVEEAPQLSEEIIGYAEKRSDMTAGATALLGTLQVICGVGIVFCTVGSVFANEAARDRNNADFNGAKKDSLRGLKIGGLAIIPMLAINITAIILKVLGNSADVFYWCYRWLFLAPVKPVVDLLTGNANTLTEAPLWAVIVFIVFTLIMLVFSWVMYIICYNEDSVIAKVLYKSTKKKKENVKRLGR